MTETNTNTTPSTENYILYRAVDYTIQPAEIKNADGTTTTPPPVVVQAKGTVIATMQLLSLDGVSVPAGLAVAEDSAGLHPIGSVYTPPA